MLSEDCVSSAFGVNFRYTTYFTHDVFDSANPILANVFEKRADNTPPRVIFIVEKSLCDIFHALDSKIKSYSQIWKNSFAIAAPTIFCEGTEECKNMPFALDICRILGKYALCRQSYVVIAGGGAFLDAVSFGASLFHRGIRQVRIPTTVLAQCDSGVGVKNAINFDGKKNLLGVFDPPEAVINDAAFIERLPMREIVSGVAEAVKVAMIKDAAFFGWLVENASKIISRDISSIEYFIRESAKIHIRHIASGGDPFENGSARPLDFGHWSAHKLEMLSKGTLRHGEAVATGLLIDTKYAVLSSLVSEKVYLTLEKLCHTLKLPFASRELEMRTQTGEREVLQGIADFHEHLGGVLSITFPTGIGSSIELGNIDLDLMDRAISECVIRHSNQEGETL